nr:PAS domain-containing protein [Marispirochaeta aestuarii]
MYVIIKNKQTLKIIEQSKAKYQKVVDNMKEGMIILNSKGKVVFINQSASKILGIPINKIGFYIFDIVDDENTLLLKSELSKRNAGRTSEYRIEYKHPELARISHKPARTLH